MNWNWEGYQDTLETHSTEKQKLTFLNSWSYKVIKMKNDK